MKHNIRFLAVLVLFAFGCFCLTSLLAQTNMPVLTNSVPVQVPPDSVSAFFTKMAPLQFVLVPIVTVSISVVRKYTTKIPEAVWPYASPFIGAGLDWLGTNFGLWSGNVAAGAMLGGLSTWFHQIDKHGPDLLSNLLPPKTTQT